MITKFKIFESVNEDEPKIGDWVLCYSEDISDDTKTFLETTIGQLVKITKDKKYTHYEVEYRNKKYTDESFNKNTFTLSHIMKILYWSENRKELEKKLEILRTANKYNI
jgi:hypothetical protein